MSNLKLSTLLFWLGGLGVVWFAISKSSYVPNDGDGTLYAQMAERIASRDLSELFVIGWYDFNKIYPVDAPESRYFYEHPPGFFVLPWILGQCGLPLSKLTLLAETLYQLLALGFIFKIVRGFASYEKSALVVLGILIMPVSFWYVLRPVQEMPMLACLMAMLYTISLVSKKPSVVFIGLIVIGGMAGLIKGLMVIPLVGVAGLAGFILGEPKARIRTATLCALAFGSGAYGLLTAFEKYRLYVFGDTFWLPYLRIQFWGRALEHSTISSILLRTWTHGAIYLGALFYYSLPWGIIAVYLGWKRTRSSQPKLNVNLEGKILLLLATSALVLSLPLSIFARWSVRYIFSGYYLLGLCGLILAAEPLLRYLEEKQPVIARIDLLKIAAIIWTLSKVGAVILVTT